jgi:hypothetical protein
MPRSPKGVVSRPLPEWNAANIYRQGASGSGSGAASFNVGMVLFNNSTGASLVCWDAEYGMFIVPSGANFPTAITGGFGVGPPSFASAASPIAGSALHQPANAEIGQIYTFNTSSATTGYGQVHRFVPQAGFWSWRHEWPFFTLPPGYGFMLMASGFTSTIGFNQWAQSFTWEVVTPAPYP